MKPPLRLLSRLSRWLLPALATATLAVASDPRAGLARRQEQVRGKITALFEQRDNPMPPLEETLNPFFRTFAIIAAPTDEEAPIEPVGPPKSPDELLLDEIKAKLRVSGTVTIDGRALVMINQLPFLAGSMIAVEVGDTTRFVRVEHIGRGEVTLSLGTAQVTIEF